MKKERHFVYLEDDSPRNLSWKWIETFQRAHNLASRGEALEKLFNEYVVLKKQNQSDNDLAKAIAREIKPQLDPIRIRTGYVDKNVRVLTNLLNSYLIISGMEDSIPVTDIVAESLRETQKQVADQIHAYQVARKDKLTRSTQGDDDE
ncbi:hypothetical protein [Lacticaseibacillus suibinensis]|uniref:hypothetical protein n=1 Tax=Lacticaseibacillus suibinensis TaxID=2486011 RepID=UPI000F7B625E|nr:hypothetical protein [Lacticaseibacillus suibinensis]